MASRLDWLRTCKLKQLEAIARATGINSSGTKSVLISHIQEGLSQPFNTPSNVASNKLPRQKQKRNDGYKIFSIDMGIRNLAYCQLVLPSTWLHPSSETIKTSTTTTTTPVTPTLRHWSRIDVSSPLDRQSTKPRLKESFIPAIFAPNAHTFLATHILPHNPTHILLERQRFRSMGGSAVQEWTLRVNMFEAMLYAILQTYMAEGKWGGEVVPVLPSKVVKYWVDGEVDGGVVEDGENEKKRKRASLGTEKSKARKMGIVRDMVQNGSGIVLQGQAKEMGDLVIGRAEGKKSADK
ncbi:MAG: hypothetical protein Q9180_005481, partial [Flavoplaca navasiana]